jgi:hypothetical protein
MTRDVDNLRVSLSQQTDAKQRAAIEQTIASAAKSMQDSLSRERTYHSRWRVVFNGKRPGGQLRREVLSPPHSPTVTLGLREQNGGFITLQEIGSPPSIQVTPRVTITGEPFWNISWFPDFGREIADREVFVTKQSPTMETNSARFLEPEILDGRELRVIETLSSLGTKRRIWIDPARGYVCPRTESFNAAGLLVRKQEASGFFQEPSSGVWFAERHMKTEFDPQTGKQQRRIRWHLDPKSVRINDPPQPVEFCLPIKASTYVSDQRPGGSQWRAGEATVLKLVNGKLDLEETPGLVRNGPPRIPWEVLPKHVSTTVRWIVTTVALVVTMGLAALVWFLKLVITRTRLIE